MIVRAKFGFYRFKVFPKSYLDVFSDNYFLHSLSTFQDDAPQWAKILGVVSTLAAVALFQLGPGQRERVAIDFRFRPVRLIIEKKSSSMLALDSACKFLHYRFCNHITPASSFFYFFILRSHLCKVLCSWFHTPVYGVRNSILNWVSKTQSLKRKKKGKRYLKLHKVFKLVITFLENIFHLLIF